MKITKIASNYLQYSQSIHTEKSHRNIKRSLRILTEHLNDTDVHKIKLFEMHQFFQMLLSNHGVYQTRIHRINISGFFQWMVEMELLETNLIRKIKAPKIPQKFPVYITEPELLQLLPHLKNDLVKTAVRIAFYTGLRQMELLTLKWEQIYDGIIHLDNQTHITKSKKIRNIPISPKIADIFIQRGTGFIFPQTKNYPYLVSKHFKKAVVKTGLNPKLHFHSLRSGFATRAVQVGVSMPVLQKLMGHADIKTTMIYAGVQDSLLNDAIMRL